MPRHLRTRRRTGYLGRVRFSQVRRSQEGVRATTSVVVPGLVDLVVGVVLVVLASWLGGEVGKANHLAGRIVWVLVLVIGIILLVSGLVEFVVYLA